MVTSSSGVHPFTYTNPINQEQECLTKEQQDTIIAVTVIFGILTAGLAVLPLLFGLSAHYKNLNIQQIKSDHDAQIKQIEAIKQEKLKKSHEAAVAKLSNNINSELAKRGNDFKKLQDKKNAGQAYTLAEARLYLEYTELMNLHRTLGHGTGHPFHSYLRDKLSKEEREIEEYFKTTHQDSGYRDIQQEAKRAALLAVGNNLDAALLADPKSEYLLRVIKGLVIPIMNNIEEKKDHQPSITNTPKELYTPEDLEILNLVVSFTPVQAKWKSRIHPGTDILSNAKDLKRTIQERMDIAKYDIYDYLHDEELLNINFEALLSKPVEELSSKEAILIAKAQHAFLEIQKNQGSYFDISMFPEFDTIRRVAQLRSEQIDAAKMLWIINSHDKAPKHPRVAIEGGGPVGLLMGITQFEAGANVSLFEKRSTQYDRTQIVKLDPKWMSALQYYLGEEYYKLFSDPNHRGIIRPDGFGEIATLFLEEAIHTRLTHLMSLLPGEGKDLPFERLAAYEVSNVQKPKTRGGKYSITAEYLPQYDPASKTPGIVEATKQTVKRKIDMLICAGGKSSPMKQRFLPSSSAVTGEEYYGVCSWLTSNIPHQDKENMNLFQDFRGMIHLDHNFLDRFESELRKEFDYYNENSVISNPGLKTLITDVLYHKAFYDLKHPERTHLQTRTFENRGLIYIGMEMPQEMRNYLEYLESYLKRHGNISQAEAAKVIKQIQKLWFQNVMHYYGMDSTSQLTIDKIDTKFAATFPVDQYRMHPEHLVSEIKHKSSKLLIAAAGDAFSSPHFMRYSGLTGGRENIFHLQDYTKGIAHKHSKRPLLQSLKGHLERTAQFVIGRGTQFLKQLNESEIRANRRDSVIASLKKKEAELREANADYRLEIHGYHHSQDGHYHLHDLRTHKTYFVVPRSGYLKIDGETYDSIDQFILQL